MKQNHNALLEALARSDFRDRMTHIALQEQLDGEVVEWVSRSGRLWCGGGWTTRPTRIASSLLRAELPNPFKKTSVRWCSNPYLIDSGCACK